MVNNLRFLQGPPTVNVETLQSNAGTFYLKNYIEGEKESNRLYIGTTDGIKSIVTPTPYSFSLALNENIEQTFDGSADILCDLKINNDGIFQLGNNHTVTHYGICSTASEINEKIVDLTGFVLIPGSRIHIKFEHTNTADLPSLNINNTGSQNINFNGKLQYLIANQIYTFIYDGQNYVLISEYHSVEGVGGKNAEVFNDYNNVAIGDYSHASGLGTIASGEAQTVIGKYNISDASSILTLGNGISIFQRSNAHTIDWNGNGWFSGDIYVGSTSGINKDEGSKKVATEDYVNIRVPNWTEADENKFLRIINGSPAWVSIPHAELYAF